MPLLLLLWLALFGVAPAAISASSAGRAVAAVRVDASGREDRAPEAIRARSVASLAAARAAGQLTPVAPERHAPPFALAAESVARDPAASETSRVLARQLSHGVTARGGHLPYFPTAPPLQG